VVWVLVLGGGAVGSGVEGAGYVGRESVQSLQSRA